MSRLQKNHQHPRVRGPPISLWLQDCSVQIEPATRLQGSQQGLDTIFHGIGVQTLHREIWTSELQSLRLLNALGKAYKCIVCNSGVSIFVVTPVYMPENPRETRLRSQAVHGGSGDRKQANWICHVDVKNPLASLARMAWKEIPYCLRLPEKVFAVTLGMPQARRIPRSTHSLRTLRSDPPGGAAQMCAVPSPAAPAPTEFPK